MTVSCYPMTLLICRTGQRFTPGARARFVAGAMGAGLVCIRGLGHALGSWQGPWARAWFVAGALGLRLVSGRGLGRALGLW